jgi:hypothetical protein
MFGKKQDTQKDTEMKEVNGDDDWERKKGKENDEYVTSPFSFLSCPPRACMFYDAHHIALSFPIVQ